jgi:hypothetical protein
MRVGPSLQRIGTGCPLTCSLRVGSTLASWTRAMKHPAGSLRRNPAGIGFHSRHAENSGGDGVVGTALELHADRELISARLHVDPLQDVRLAEAVIDGAIRIVLVVVEEIAHSH